MAQQVVNIKYLSFSNQKEWPDNFIYIGRANRFKRLKKSKWSNPFKVNSEKGRFNVIGQYARYKILEPGFREEVQELVDKTLVCWCYPSACHGIFLSYAVIASHNNDLWNNFENIWLKSINDEKSFYESGNLVNFNTPKNNMLFTE